MNSDVTAIVVAAGSGVRLGGGVPKALRILAGKPLVLHAVENLLSGGCSRVIVMIAESERESFEAALAVDGLGAPVELVAGGVLRQDSVANGLARVTSEFVLVHDAARPLVPSSVVAEIIAELRAGSDCVIPVLPVVDSIREVGEDGDSSVVDRERLRAVQTPQGFRATALIQAHHRVSEMGIEVTDDAAAVELIGTAVRLIPGSELAMKVTRPIDLVIAEQLLKES